MPKTKIATSKRLISDEDISLNLQSYVILADLKFCSFVLCGLLASNFGPLDAQS